jgi:hypothetical protein
MVVGWLVVGGLLYLMPLSTIFQLQYGGKIYVEYDCRLFVCR